MAGLLHSDEPVPQSHVVDESGLLDSGRAERLTAALRSAAGKGIHVFLAAYSELPDGEFAGERAQRLASDWVGDKLGAVLVFSQKDAKFALATSTAFSRMQASRDVNAVVERATRALKQGRSLEVVLREAALDLEYEVRMARTEVEESKRIKLPLTIGGLALVLLLIAGVFLVAMNYLRHHNLFDHAYVFPEEPIPPRLGGPVSGGHSAVLKVDEK